MLASMRALRRQSAIGLCLSFLIGLSPAYDDVLSGKLLLAGLGDGGRRAAEACSRVPTSILRGPGGFRTIAVRGQARARDQCAARCERLRAFGVGIQKPPIGNGMFVVISRQRGNGVGGVG